MLFALMQPNMRRAEKGAASITTPTSVVARYDYIPEKSDELRLTAGDVVSVGAAADESGWMTGLLRGVVGAFPAA